MAPYLRMTISVGHGKGKASQLQTSPSSHVFCFTGYKLRKTDPESSNYLRYFTGNVFPDCNCFCPPFWKRDAADNLSRTRNVHDFWQCEVKVISINFSYACMAGGRHWIFSSGTLISLTSTNPQFWRNVSTSWRPIIAWWLSDYFISNL